MKLVQMLVMLMSLQTFFACSAPLRASESQILSENQSNPIVVIAIAKIKPGREAEFQQAVSLILPPTRKESGNRSFAYHQSTENVGEFAFIEQWASQEALDTHMKTPHMQAFFAAVGTLFEPGFPQIKSYRRINE